ncbi:MAG: hypothetical protein JO340_21020 [Acidobacteriaceae bacterium]|nr:hypothetical protein [Acidobacteriaceae bacterium]
MRLDIAVSEGKEIFAWHGQDRFCGSSSIDEVVQGGTVTSGEFVSFLANIFVRPGVRFEYMGDSVIDDIETYSFRYSVPLAASGYHIGTKRGKPLVPFHGSFTARASDYQLGSLSVIADEIPEDSLICSAETDMAYRVVKISGQDALAPSSFTLKLDDLNHQYTVSRSEFSQCRKYAAESTLHFDADNNAAANNKEAAREIELPAGIEMHIALRTPISDRTAYTGDPVEGVLLNAVKVKGAGAVIPKGSVAEGVISLLENFEEPDRHYLVKIEFHRIAFGHSTFVFQASPQMSKLQTTKLVSIYGNSWPAYVHNLAQDGVLVFRSEHFELDKHFADYWITQAARRHEGNGGSEGR